LGLEIRRNLYSLICKSPGLYFREIQRRTQIATGQLTYHLDYLHKVDLVETRKDGEYLRYYAHAQINDEEKRILAFLYEKSVRHILLHLLEHKRCNHEYLVENLDISPSTVSWHLKKLVNAGIVSREVQGRKSFYSVNDPELVKIVLIKYRENLLDKLVDRFIEMWET